jgi:hypothetical protein
MSELESLRRLVARTGEDLSVLIDVPEDIRDALDAYCAAYPGDAGDIRKALAYRDFMMEHL